MGSPLDFASFDKIKSQAQDYFFQHVLSSAMAAQIVVVALACLLAYKATRAINAWFASQQEQCSEDQKYCADLTTVTPFIKVIGPLIAVFFLQIAAGIAGHFHWPRDGITTAVVIFFALFVDRLFTARMESRFWARILEIVIWFWATMHLFHLVEPWQNLLRHIHFELGQVHLTMFIIFRAFILLLLLYWL
ncbi:MAG: hypothetical protein M1438_08350, partial [Deltaproteobacteria bacterium]|nr:hypothetical protein [Deltaproteobacteria bacterium]